MSGGVGENRMQRIRVTASRTYDVCVQEGLLARAGACVAGVCRASAAALISDETVFALYGETVKASLEAAGFRVVCFLFPAGESQKNLTTYGEILHFLAACRLKRSDVIVSLGGGVVGDIAGFAASTYLRGLSYVQIPTTLLSAVDSSVGGKTAINLDSAKNQVGTFYQPALVLCDPLALRSLPEQSYREGCAEAIKYGVMGDERFFSELLDTPVCEQLAHVIAHCVMIKRDCVAADEFDLGNRRLLNLGHTIGHAVESCSRYTVSHGYAVAIGMTMITRAAWKRNICKEETLDRLCAILERYGLPTETEYTADALYEAARSDKKISASTLELVLPEDIGRCRLEQIALTEFPAWLRDGGAR